MSATGFTPIQLYRSTTASAAPVAGNLAAGELAINTTDEKLYFKNTAGVVTLLASSSGASGTVTSVSGTGTVNGLTLTGTVTSSGSITLGGTLSVDLSTATVTGTLPVTKGGTGVTTSTGTGSVVRNTSPALVTPNLGTPTALTLTNATGLPLTTGVTGTLAVANGGTGAATLTANYVLKGNGTSAVSVSQIFDNGTTVGVNQASPAANSKLDLSGGFVGNITAVAASAVNCSAGNFFTKTATGALTWTVTNVPASRAYSFILELTNGGTGAQTWFTGIKWPGGVAPTLTTSGVDVLGFITDDGGTTWRGVQLMKDSK